jgi:endonuclease YncB( thermonuclease family)
MQPTITPPGVVIVTFNTTQDPATVTFDGVDHTTPYAESVTAGNDHTILIQKTGYDWMIEGTKQTTPVTRTILVDTVYTETLTPAGVTPPTPPTPDDYAGTWLDPNYWRDRYGIDIPETDAELTITKTIAPAITLTVRGVQYQKEPWYFCNAPGDENDYICDGDGQLYVRDMNRLYEFSLTETLTNILAWFNITQAVDAGLRGVWLDGAGNGYVWNDANKLLVPVILAQQNIPLQAGGGGALFRIGTKIWKWLKGSPGTARVIWKKTPKGTLILLGASSGQWVNGLVNGAQIVILIEGYATITEWGIEETVGTASLGAYQASRMKDTELYTHALNNFEMILDAGEAIHNHVKIVPGLSPVITLFLKANRDNLNTYKKQLAAMPVTEPVKPEDIISKTPPTVENMTGSRVVKILDGDTINVRYNHVTYTVRFVGINAHEISHGSGKAAEFGGNAARDFLQRIIRDGTNVDISIDLATPADAYGRLLGVVKLNNIDINLLMLRIGAARTLFIGANKHVNQTTYQAAEDNAKKMKLGIWNLNKTPKFTVPAEIEAALGIGINAPTAAKLKVFGSVNVPTIEKLIAQELALASGGTYMVTDGKTRKVVDVDDRETKTVKFTPEAVPGETGTIVIEGIADASKVKIVKLEEIEITKPPGAYEVSDIDEKKLVRVKAGKKAKTRLHPDKPPLA